MQEQQTADSILTALRPAQEMVARLPENPHGDAARRAIDMAIQHALHAIQQPLVPAGGPTYTN
jgi:hypothetical protein